MTSSETDQVISDTVTCFNSPDSCPDGLDSDGEVTGLYGYLSTPNRVEQVTTIIDT